MEKCIWCNLKTRLAFESKLTISKIQEIADDMSRRMPPGEDLRFQMPGSSELKQFPITQSLEPTVTSKMRGDDATISFIELLLNVC